MKNLVIAAAIVAVGVVGYLFPQSKTVYIEPGDNVGAVSGPDVSSPYFSINGVVSEYRSMKTAQGTTTLCALRSPTYATSTLVSGLVRTATSTDYVLVIAKSSSPNATTTLIRTETVTQDGQVIFPTSSTTVTAVSDSDRTFAPGQYLVVSSNTNATTVIPGSCSAEFLVGASF